MKRFPMYVSVFLVIVIVHEEPITDSLACQIYFIRFSLNILCK